MTVRVYLHELLKETSLRVGTLAGSVSTVSTFFPSLSQAWWLRWLGLLCIVVGFLVANFRLARHGTSSAARLQDVIGELRFNASCLQTINASTALERRTDTMQQALDDVEVIRTMHAAKEHTSPPRVRQRTQGWGCVAEPPLSTLPPSKSHRANESPAAAF
jgi:hypothetical protein